MSVSGSHPDREVRFEPVEPVAPVAAPGLSGGQTHSGQSGSGNHGSDDLSARDALARVLDPVAYDPKIVAENVGQEWDRTNRQMEAMAHARAALAAGYRPAPTLDAALVDLITADYDESWSIPTRPHAEAIADRILRAGYRLVSDDDVTVDRVARAMIANRLPAGCDDLDRMRAWRRLSDREREGWRATARAAVRALLGENRNA